MPPVALSRILADFWLEGVGVTIQTLADRPRKKNRSLKFLVLLPYPYPYR